MRGLRMITLLALLISTTVGSAQSHARDLLIFAPSSMTEVMESAVAAFNKAHQVKAVLSIAGTPQLARQLDAGAPADIFITADRDWMDWAVARGLVKANDISPLAGNRLVLAVRNEIENWADVDGLLTTSRFAMAEPESVPAGRYARQALKHRKLWKKARLFAEFGDNVRITTRRLARGEVAAALVYGTDVVAEPGIKPLYTFPKTSHDPIIYWMSKVKGSNGKLSDMFVDHLKGAGLGTIFAKAGFLPPSAVISKVGEENQ